MMKTTSKTAKIPVKTHLSHTSNGADVIRFEFKNVALDKLFNEELFYLQSVIKSVERTIGHKLTGINSFTSSYMFHKQLSLLDHKIKCCGNVYMKHGKQPGTVKIGRCYKLNRRYGTDERDKIIKLVPVLNDTQIEARLLKEFNKVYELVPRTKETFICPNLREAERLFTSSINRSEIVKFDSSDTNGHVKRYRTIPELDGLWCSTTAARVIINNYVEEPNLQKDFLELFDAIDARISKDIYIYYEFNKQLRQECMYWMFHKYVVIQNNDDLMVNGSRLWNSIYEREIKGKVKAKPLLSTFLKSKHIQHVHEQFKQLFPNDAFYTEKLKNTGQPQFNGIYVHYTLVHFIVEHLDAKYALMVAELMFRRFKPSEKKNRSEALSGGAVGDTDGEEEEEESEEEEDDEVKNEYIQRYMTNRHSMKDLISLKTIMGI